MVMFFSSMSLVKPFSAPEPQQNSSIFLTGTLTSKKIIFPESENQTLPNLAGDSRDALLFVVPFDGKLTEHVNVMIFNYRKVVTEIDVFIDAKISFSLAPTSCEENKITSCLCQ